MGLTSPGHGWHGWQSKGLMSFPTFEPKTALRKSSCHGTTPCCRWSTGHKCCSLPGPHHSSSGSVAWECQGNAHSALKEDSSKLLPSLLANTHWNLVVKSTAVFPHRIQKNYLFYPLPPQMLLSCVTYHWSAGALGGILTSNINIGITTKAICSFLLITNLFSSPRATPASWSFLQPLCLQHPNKHANTQAPLQLTSTQVQTSHKGLSGARKQASRAG